MDLNDIHDVDDWSEITLRALIDRLERSTSDEQFIYRESELDEIWRVVDIARARATDAERDRLGVISAAIMRAHDLVGMEGKPREAAEELRRLNAGALQPSGGLGFDR